MSNSDWPSTYQPKFGFSGIVLPEITKIDPFLNILVLHTLLIPNPKI